jgi:anaerobic magnesium-protoporphyrin IX monomethyl ester cyclase
MRFTLIYGTDHARPMFRKKQFGIQVPVYPPLGLLYLGSALEQAGHEAEIIDFNIDKDPYSAIDKSIHHSDAIGLSVDNESFCESAQIAQYIKNKDPHIPIVIGGPHCTIYQEQSLVNIPAADICVNGDGEHAIVDIAETLEGTRSLNDIPGVLYRRNSVIVHGRPAELIINLNSLPFPARHLVAKYDYGKSNKLFMYKPRLTSIATARGCPYRCQYCIYHAIWHHRYRQRSVENVISEFHGIIEQGYQTVMFADPIFLANQKRAHAIMDELIAMDSSLELFIGGNRADITDRTLYEKMRQAGVKYLSFGLGSGNQDVIDFLGKHTTVEQIQNVVRLTDDLGFFIHGTFILGAPFEDRNHFKKTIEFACSLPLDSVTFYPMVYRKGSDLWQDAFAQGKIHGDIYKTFADKGSGLSPFTKKEIFKYCRWATQRFFYRPHYIIHLFTKALKNDDFRWVHSIGEDLLLSLRLHKIKL